MHLITSQAHLHVRPALLFFYFTFWSGSLGVGLSFKAEQINLGSPGQIWYFFCHCSMVGNR